MQFSTGTICRACATADRSSRFGYSSTVLGSRFATIRPTNERQQRAWHLTSTISNKTYIKGKVHCQRWFNLRHANVFMLERFPDHVLRAKYCKLQMYSWLCFLLVFKPLCVGYADMQIYALSQVTAGVGDEEENSHRD